MPASIALLREAERRVYRKNDPQGMEFGCPPQEVLSEGIWLRRAGGSVPPGNDQEKTFKYFHAARRSHRWRWML